MQQYFFVRAQCIRSDSASRVQRHAAGAIARQGCQHPKGTSCGRVTLPPVRGLYCLKKKCIIGMLLMLSGRMCTDGENLQVIVGVLCAADTLMISLL